MRNGSGQPDISALSNEEVRQIIAQEIGIETSEVHDDSRLLDDLGATSLEIVLIVMALEKRFGLSISDENIRKISTVKDVFDFIKKQQNESAATGQSGQAAL